MAKYDRISALFWIGMALAICEESIRLGPGSLSVPGPGLVPLGCGLALGIFALIIFIQTFKNTAQRKEVLWDEGTLWRKLILALASLVCYAFFLDILGFLWVTFLWLTFVCKLGRLGWKRTIIMAIVTTSACYVLFNYLLGIHFPRGILG